jgi:hypothetical protein
MWQPKLAQYHANNNIQHGIEVEIHNALVELGVLRDELGKPDLILTYRDPRKKASRSSARANGLQNKGGECSTMAKISPTLSNHTQAMEILKWVFHVYYS